MRLLGSVPIFEQAQSQGGPCWAVRCIRGISIWQHRLMLSPLPHSIPPSPSCLSLAPAPLLLGCGCCWLVLLALAQCRCSLLSGCHKYALHVYNTWRQWYAHLDRIGLLASTGNPNICSESGMSSQSRYGNSNSYPNPALGISFRISHIH